MLVKSLKLHGVKNHLTIYDHVVHGWGLATGSKASGWLKEAVDFWNVDLSQTHQ